MHKVAIEISYEADQSEWILTPDMVRLLLENAVPNALFRVRELPLPPAPERVFNCDKCGETAEFIEFPRETFGDTAGPYCTRCIAKWLHDNIPILSPLVKPKKPMQPYEVVPNEE